MKARIAAASIALALAAAPLSSALAYDGQGRYTAFAPHETEMLGGYEVYSTPSDLGCPMNSAAEGNANQQAFPTQQYGQTSGGARC